MKNFLLDEVTQALPKKFVQSLMERRPKVYKEAVESIQNDPSVESPEAEYLIPHKRRALFEGQFRALATECGLRATVEKNVRQTATYTLVRAGRFWITCSHVRKDINKLRPAAFRRQHAGINRLLPQSTFFYYDEVKRPGGLSIPDGDLYAIILHCVESRDCPGFLKLAFPDETNKLWADHFDFSRILEAYAPDFTLSNDEVIDLGITWKKRQKRKEDEQ